VKRGGATEGVKPAALSNVPSKNQACVFGIGFDKDSHASVLKKHRTLVYGLGSVGSRDPSNDTRRKPSVGIVTLNVVEHACTVTPLLTAARYPRPLASHSPRAACIATMKAPSQRNPPYQTLAARVRSPSGRYYGGHVRAAPATGRVVSFPRMGPRRRRYDPGGFCTGK